MAINQADIDNWFSYHPPTPEQLVAYNKIRAAAKVYAETINKHVPDGADKTTAMRTIRNSVMQANLAVACYVGAPKRPTIAELDAILNSENDTPVTINRDGSITVEGE
jgi:hypothetical protein